MELGTGGRRVFFMLREFIVSFFVLFGALFFIVNWIFRFERNNYFSRRRVLVMNVDMIYNVILLVKRVLVF